MLVAKTEFYCPVCGRDQEYLSVWRERGTGRIRIFCVDCSHSPEYQSLAKEERTILNKEGFERFAAARLLRHVFEKEQARHTDSPFLLAIDVNFLNTSHYEEVTVAAADRDGNEVSYTGIRIADILRDHQPSANAKRIAFIGTDGYVQEFPLEEVNADQEAIIAVTNDSTFRSVLPSKHLGNWVNNLIRIAIK
jgi:hypothetical protein